MKTQSIAARSRCCLATAVPSYLRALAVAVALSSLLVAAQAQTVTTLGGGPKSLPIEPENSGGNASGNTLGQAQFNGPAGLAVGPDGSLYVADFTNGLVRRISSPGNTAASVTSTIITNTAGPIDVKFDAGGSLYLLTQTDGIVRRYSTAGVLLGTNATGLATPTAFTLDASTNLYIAELGGAVKKFGPGGTGTVATIATAGVALRGIALLETNNIVVTDSGNHNLQSITISSTATNVTLFAGGTAAGFVDGLSSIARFNQPWQVGRAPNGSLVVADRGNHRVRIVTFGGSVVTLYGKDSNQWATVTSNGSFPELPGWKDGPTTEAAARDPFGVFASSDGDSVFVTETAWNLVRQVTGAGLQAPTTGGSGGGGTGGSANTNLTANLISFGFQSGEGSSDFIGGPGQFFSAPVTLTILPGQTMYSLGFTLAVTNGTGSLPFTNGNFGFDTMLVQPTPSGFFIPISNLFATAIAVVVSTNPVSGDVTTNEVPVFSGAIFTNASAPGVTNILSVAWMEVLGKTNLYNTLTHDLITFSQAHINIFNKASGSVILGAFTFRVPTNAPVGSTYKIQVFNASAQTNLSGGVRIEAPTGGSLSNGPINSVKVVTVGIRPYLVGDVSNFRWLNAGEFGDGTLSMDDAAQTFLAGVYGLNVPAPNSAFFDAMDSAGGITTGTASSGDINAVAFGDGLIDVKDVFVTLRRSLDPYSTWYARYWTNDPTTLFVSAVTSNNLEKPTFPGARVILSSPSSESSGGGESSVNFRAGDAVASGQTITVPIMADVAGARPLRVFALRIVANPLDGAPPLTNAVQFQFAQAGLLGNAWWPGNPTPGSYAAAWLNSYMPGLGAGSHLLGNLVITLPAGAPSNAAYAIEFAHASASDNGVASLAENVQRGLATVVSRDSSSWGDAIPDSWRLKQFGTLYNILSAANADADGDGVTNLAEFKAGTDPNNVASALKMLASRVAASEGSAFKLRWPTVQGRTYVLECSTSLFSGDWTAVSSEVLGDGREVEFTDPNPDGARFYRVRLVE